MDVTTIGPANAFVLPITIPCGLAWALIARVDEWAADTGSTTDEPGVTPSGPARVFTMTELRTCER